MDYLAKQFGKNVTKARQAKGFTQEEFAIQCGIDRSYMSRIERGIVNVTLEKVYDIAEVLGCPLTKLLPSMVSYKRYRKTDNN